MRAFQVQSVYFEEIKEPMEGTLGCKIDALYLKIFTFKSRKGFQILI